MPTHCLKSGQQAQSTRTFYNPIGFDPAEVLPLHLHRYADYARFFLHVLYSQRVFKEIKDDEFVPLKAAYLRRFFPDNTVYKQVRDALLDSETIVCDGICYQADTLTWRNHNDRHRGGKCFGYKLGPRWEGVRHERVTLTTKPLFKSIDKVNKKRQTEIVLLAAPTHLALSPRHHDRSPRCRPGTRRLDGRMPLKKRSTATPVSACSVMGLIMAIGSGMSAILAGSTTMSPASRSRCDNILRANNHSLVGCDVTNSQPLLVGLLCSHLKQGLLTNNLCNDSYSSQFDHYIEIDQEFLDHISSLSQKQQEEGGRGDRGTPYTM